MTPGVAKKAQAGRSFLLDSVAQRHDVFVVGGQPTVTYNPRPTQVAGDRLRDYLDERGRILCITGPTKSGKTVLVRQVMPYSIRISGAALASIDDFWKDIVDRLVVYTDETAERIKVDGTGSNIGVDASLKAGGTGVGFTAGMSDQSAFTHRHSESRSRGHRQVACAALAKHRPPLIVDDFHHIDPDVQRAIVGGLKDLVFERVPIIFVAVPHHAADVVRAEREMGGRVEHLEIAPWSSSELEDIGRRGFAALNMNCPPDTATHIARESYGSPHLMQNFCLQICKDRGVTQTLSAGGALAGQIGEVDEHFFRRLAVAQGPSETYDRLARGPLHGTNRLGRRLKDNSVVDIYAAVLRAIAHTGPEVTLDWTAIRVALKQVLEDEPPRRSECARVLDRMSEIARDMVWDSGHQRANGDPVLEFHGPSGQLHISDPFFAYYLRWRVRSDPNVSVTSSVGGGGQY